MERLTGTGILLNDWHLIEWFNPEQVGAGALRVYVESEESVEETPVLVVVRHEKGVLSWQLPLMLQVHYKINKFFC